MNTEIDMNAETVMNVTFEYTNYVEKDALTGKIIGAAIEVHRALGPGLLESVYETCLAYELKNKKLNVECQKSIPIVYKGLDFDCGYRIDMIVENQVVVEIKSVSDIVPIHKAQLLSYLKLSSYKTGLLINFNVNILTDGIQRMKA